MGWVDSGGLSRKCEYHNTSVTCHKGSHMITISFIYFNFSIFLWFIHSHQWAIPPGKKDQLTSIFGHKIK